MCLVGIKLAHTALKTKNKKTLTNSSRELSALTSLGLYFSTQPLVAFIGFPAHASVTGNHTPLTKTPVTIAGTTTYANLYRGVFLTTSRTYFLKRMSLCL